MVRRVLSTAVAAVALFSLVGCSVGFQTGPSSGIFAEDNERLAGAGLTDTETFASAAFTNSYVFTKSPGVPKTGTRLELNLSDQPLADEISTEPKVLNQVVTIVGINLGAFIALALHVSWFSH